MKFNKLFKQTPKPLFKDKQPNYFLENFKTIIYAIIIAVIFRSLFFEPFHIPSGSMKSGLREGDFILVSKFSYGYSKYSFPLGIMPIKERIFLSEPELGDVVVFRLPSQPRINYIKRLVAGPGDKVSVRSGVLYINDVEVVRERLDELYIDDAGPKKKYIPEYKETMPNGRSYNVLDQYANGSADNVGPFYVPKGHYFFMGDNRDNSQDSRYMNHVGFVPRENIVGKASVIFMSSSDSLIKFWKWPTSIRFSRVFKRID